MKRISVLTALLLVLTGFLVGRSDAQGTSPGSVERLSGLERDTLAGLNAVRASNGLRPLVLSNGLRAAAVAHSQSMLGRGFFEHESADGSPFFVRIRHYYGPAGFSGWSVGENLLYSSGQMSGAKAIATWLGSAPHRRNLLSPAWREVGVSALHASSPGGVFGGDPTVVITMDFGTRSGGVTRHLSGSTPTSTSAA
jgi:uncharacterized protein YkwD